MLLKIPLYEMIERLARPRGENPGIGTDDYEDYDAIELEGKGLIIYY